MALSSAYINRFNAPFARSDVAVRKSVLRHVHLKYFISEAATFGALALDERNHFAQAAQYYS